MYKSKVTLSTTDLNVENMLMAVFDCHLFIVDPAQVIGLFPDLLPADFRKQLEYPAPPPQLTPGEVEKGCLALVEYLTQVSLPLFALH